MMKYLILIVLAFGITSQPLIAQKTKKVTPTSTTASARWEGYLQRQKLLEESLIKNIPFRNVGPTIMNGRVVDLAVDPKDPTHFYVAYASGGLWETKNEGASFEPLFENEIVMTIGDIDVDWTNDVIYVGTGENNSSRSSYSGYGIFKSDNNGKSWTHLGLEETHHIGRVIIHPTDPNVIWVASLGHLYSENESGGIYKSVNGGKTWEKTLYVNKKTGFVELVINPNNPQELMAASWQKDRKAWNFEEAGEGSAIFKSKDGGITWVNVASGDNGFPDTNGTGRIGLAYAPSQDGLVYAVLDNQDRRESEEKETYAVTKDLLRNSSKTDFASLNNKDLNDFLDRNDYPDDFSAVDLKVKVSTGEIKPSDLISYIEDANSLLFDTPVKGAEVYKSINGGETWEKTHEGYIESLVFSYGYYFGQIRVDGLDPKIIYTMGVPLIKSMDGGASWAITDMENVHADHHALWVNPSRSGHLINGNDGGVNISYDFGETWVKCNSTAVGQFYSVNVDMAEPYNVYGGLQDNGTWKGPSTYEYSRSWYEEGKYPYERLMGGDGMQVVIDTRDNTTVYTGYQFGNYFRINTSTGKQKYITPKHELGDTPLRWNWQSPIQLSTHNQDIVYFGSNKFHRSMNQGDTFETLSGDLTNGGKKGDVAYGTLTSISESPIRFGLIYTGSDDGLVHLSKDAGQSWTNITGTLPVDFWVSRVTASAHAEGRVYVSLNGYRSDDFNALVYVSDDYGTTWKQIGLDLPKEPVNVIKEDPSSEDILYVGTDHGVYASIDRGASFMSFGGKLPAVAVHDLVIHPREKDLVVGTHGRSIYIADIEPLQALPKMKNDSLKIFPIESKTLRKNWGKKGSWHWDGFNEPEITITSFSKDAKEATMKVMKNSIVLWEQSIELDKGLNYIKYELTITESGAKALFDSSENAEEISASSNGKIYLPAGEYQVSLDNGLKSALGTLTIDPALTKPSRKGSED